MDGELVGWVVLSCLLFPLFGNSTMHFLSRLIISERLCLIEITRAGKRRSVMLAGLYGQKRIESIKRKQAEGCKLLTEVVESPSAQHNGVFKFEDESEVKVPAQPTKSTGIL